MTYLNDTYTDSNGKTWKMIRSFKALSRAMYDQYGSNWQYEVRYTYGDEQLGI